MGQKNPKVMKWAEDAQKNKMGQRSPNGTKELKSDEMGQGSPKQHEYKPNDSTGLLEFGKHTTDPNKAKFATNSHWGDSNKTITVMNNNFLATLGGS